MSKTFDNPKVNRTIVPQALDPFRPRPYISLLIYIRRPSDSQTFDPMSDPFLPFWPFQVLVSQWLFFDLAKLPYSQWTGLPICHRKAMPRPPPLPP